MTAEEPFSISGRGTTAKHLIRKIPILGDFARWAYRKIRNSDALDALKQECDALKQEDRHLSLRLDRLEREKFSVGVRPNPAEHPALASTLLSFVDLAFPWSPVYTQDVTEEWLRENMKHHAYFISLVETYAHRSAQGRIPKLLEVGGGGATMAIGFSRRNYDVIQIDHDPLMVAKAMQVCRTLGGFAKMICMSGYDLNLWKEGFFDVAFSQGTLEHMDSDGVRKLIAAQLAVARYVVFSVPSVFWPNREFGNERKMSLEEWSTILQSCDAKVLHLSYYPEQNWHVAAVLTHREESWQNCQAV